MANFEIETKNMNLHYGEFHALKNISLGMEANRITAFIGPSACGISSFLKTINRMNDLVTNAKVDGKLLYDGTDIYRVRTAGAWNKE